MTIEIIKQPPLRLTQSELNRLRDEYNRAYSFYAGTPPAFEDWARERNQQARNRMTAEVKARHD